MNNDFSIDVVIPIYNSERYIIHTLESVVNQTLKPNKIIVVDDGSTDKSKEAVLSFSQKSSMSIEYIHTVNGGPSKARNIGTNKSQAKYIAFLDADDVWEKDKLEKQLNLFQHSSNKKLGAVYCKYSFINGEGRKIFGPRNVSNLQCYKGNIEEYLLKKSSNNDFLCNPCQILLLRSFFVEIKGFDEDLRYAEDWDFFLRLSRKCEFDFVDEDLLKIRDHATNTTKDIIYVEVNKIKFFAKNYKLLKYNKNYCEDLCYFVMKNFKNQKLKNMIKDLTTEERTKVFPIMKGNIIINIFSYLPKWVVKSIYLRTERLFLKVFYFRKKFLPEIFLR